MSNIGYEQSFECMICFDKRNKFFAHSLVDMSAETFNRYSIEQHLREKHPIDEILKWFTDHHYEVMQDRINPTSRCNYPDRSVDISDKVMNGLERFAQEWKLTFRKKKKPKVKLKPKGKMTKTAARKILSKTKKRLKVKARITHR